MPICDLLSVGPTHYFIYASWEVEGFPAEINSNKRETLLSEKIHIEMKAQPRR